MAGKYKGVVGETVTMAFLCEFKGPCWYAIDLSYTSPLFVDA